MTIQQLLDQYCLARAQQDRIDQLRIANLLVDEAIPEMIERYAATIIERNQARDAVRYDTTVL